MDGAYLRLCAAAHKRKGFEGLYGLARDRLRCDPLSGHVFLFANASRNRLKLLFWDGSGGWVCAQRLEKGRFRWPESARGQAQVVLSHEELALRLGGIDLAQTRRRRWYRALRQGEQTPASVTLTKHLSGIARRVIL